MLVIKKIFLAFACSFSLLLHLKANELQYTQPDYSLNYGPLHDGLDTMSAQSLSAAAISLYMAHAAQRYGELISDSVQLTLPLKDRSSRLYVVNPVDETDTLYQIDCRIYSHRGVGWRYNRMVIIRPYTKEVVPCILYTHGNGGNLNTWMNYYMTGAPSFIHRGYAVAFYENFNNSFFTANSLTDPVYRQWVHNNLADSNYVLPEDYSLQRGYFLLYQYAYAAQVFLNYIADDYHLDKNQLFAAGHSAGGLSSLMLSFADPSENFQHPLFKYCGAYDNRVHPNMPRGRMPIKGVLASAAGIPDDVEGSYFSDFVSNGDPDLKVVMIHGAKDPLASVDYGPALWSRFVDSVKLMGPLTLHKRLNDVGIQNYAFINCSGEHGVFTYPRAITENSGVFRKLSPFSYDYDGLNDEFFRTDTSLRQIQLHYQQMDSIIRNVAQVFARVKKGQAINLPSTIFTWSPSNMSLPIDLDVSVGYPVATDCKIEGASLERFDLDGGIPTTIKNTKNHEFLIYPNPSDGFLHIQHSGSQPLKVLVSDVTGRQKLYMSNVFSSDYMDISLLGAGMYFISFLDERNQIIASEKIILQK